MSKVRYLGIKMKVPKAPGPFIVEPLPIKVIVPRPRQCDNSSMIIGDRLRELREAKKLSQGDIEKRTGLLRCYVSRVENGHTVPAIETLEKMANAFEVPLYQLFYEGEEPPKLPTLSSGSRLTKPFGAVPARMRGI
jgi:DNA-binding XRE family transcriptional regulator